MVLEHLFTPQQALSELHRVLRPGGRVLVYVPFIIHLHQQPIDYLRYTCHGIRRLVAEAGFVDIATYGDCTGVFSAAHLAEWAYSRVSSNISATPETQTMLSQTAQTLLGMREAIAQHDPGLPVAINSDQGDFALGYVVTATKPDGPLRPLNLRFSSKIDVMHRFVQCPDA